MANGQVFDEATGVYRGVLAEDMMETFSRVGRTFCSVRFERLFSEELFPLTYVPSDFRVLPLRAGTQVMCQFSQGSMAYPVLYKVLGEYPSEMRELPDAPGSGQEVSFPELGDLVAVQKLSDSCYLYATEGQVYLWTGEGHFVFDSGQFFGGVSEFSLLLDRLAVEASDAIDLKSTSSESVVTVGNAVDTLGNLFSSLVDILVSMTTTGSPYQHSVSPDTVASLAELQARVRQVLG